MQELTERELTKDLETSVEDAIRKMAAPTKSAVAEPTLHEQMARYESNGRKLLANVQEMRVRLQEEFDRKAAEIRNGHARKVGELELQRDDDLRRLAAYYHDKVHELADMLRRLENRE